MDFDFTDDQEQLRDAVRRWVDKGFAFERRHALAKAGGDTREVWASWPSWAWPGWWCPRAHGGMGFGAVEAMVVMEELGRGLVNAPYAQAALVAPTLLAAAPAALQDAWLPKIAGGEALVVLAQQERAARYRLDHVATRARRGRRRLDAQRHQDASCRPATRPMPSSSRRASAAARTIPPASALFLVDKGAAGADSARLPDAGRRARRRPGAGRHAGHAADARRPRRAGARGRHRHRRRSAPRPSA